MNSLFNSGSDPDVDDKVRSGASPAGGASAAAEDEGMLFSSVRRAAGSDGIGHSGADKEITLGTMTVLGLFFALAVLCAGFFGFGYSSGLKHSARPPGAAIASADGSSLPVCKPAPGSPAGSAASLAASATPVNVPYTPPSALPTPKPATVPTVISPMSETPAESAPIERTPVRTSTAANTAAPMPATAPAGEPQVQTMVQVAALSHQADADLVASTLKGRGYNVAIHSSPADTLLHVQLGPFASRKEADAMRQRLLNDGFNAILK